NSYGATALSFAADKGHLEVVKLLLKHKANPNVKDTFYKATPLFWAVYRGHTDIAKALLDGGAEAGDDALVIAASEGHAAIVRAIIDKAKPKEESLTQALAATPAKHTAVIELLTKAGAKPPPKIDPAVERELAPYAGTYRSEAGTELKIAISEG